MKRRGQIGTGCWVAVGLLLLAPGAGGSSEIHDAAAIGDMDRVQVLVHEDSSLIDRPDGQGRTALMLAAEKGNTALLVFLLEHGADPDLKDEHGHEALWFAQRSGKTDPVAVLEAGRKIKPLDQALLTAAAQGDSTEVRRLLAQGADANAYDHQLFSPLMLASRRGDVATMRELISHGADPERADIQNCNVLIHSVMGGRASAADFLLAEYPDRFSRADREKALAHAAVRGNVAMAQVLLATDGGMDLSQALLMAALQGNVDFARLLLDHGAPVNAVDEYGWTPLTYAAREGHAEMVKLLVDRGADLEHRTGGRTALELAARTRSPETVAVLRAAGAESGRAFYLEYIMKYLTMPITALAFALAEWTRLLDRLLPAKTYGHGPDLYTLLIMFMPYLAAAGILAGMIKGLSVGKGRMKILKLILGGTVEMLSGLALLFASSYFFDRIGSVPARIWASAVIPPAIVAGAILLYIAATAFANRMVLRPPRPKSGGTRAHLAGSAAKASGLGLIFPVLSGIMIILHYNSSLPLLFYWPMQYVTRIYLP